MPRNERRSRSRSPIPRNQDESSRTLWICNLPRDWGFEQIKDFIRESASDPLVGHGLRFVEVLNNKGECLAKFHSQAAAACALKDLNGAMIGDRRLHVRINDKPLISKPRGINKYSSNDSPIRDNNQQSNENFETYGLNLSFLNSLGVTPPLVNRIFVNNLDRKVTEEKLREVFGMAGIITNVILIKKNESSERVSAKIEFDHPVEAVQAVSMFHGQELYDKRILTRLDHMTKGPLTKIPQGLKNIGSGLGSNGEPMRQVRLNLELQALRQELSKIQSAGAKPFDNQINLESNNGVWTSDAANQLMLNNLNQTNNQMLLNAMFNGIASNNTQIWGSMMQNPLALALQTQGGALNQLAWKTGNQGMLNQAGVMQGNVDPNDQSNQINFAMSNQTWQGNQDNNRRRFDDRDQVFADDNMDLVDNRGNDDSGRVEASDMVVFTNLPPTVSSHVLKSKMREIGDVKFVEMNGQGRAIVRFFSARDGERCLKTFHKSRVDGQIINVDYF